MIGNRTARKLGYGFLFALHISEIISKNGPTLKSGFGVVQGKMASINRPYTTFYWSAIVTIALPCSIFELFGIE